MGVPKVKSKPGSRHGDDIVARELDMAAVERLSRRALDLHLELVRRQTSRDLVGRSSD